jgi:hypothetical protein|tara:strand:+ start:51 stop:275 length:225 start_codon:yes stop_codon:yes gene_type:complete
MKLKEILSQTPLAKAIELHIDTFGYPPEFSRRTTLGDSLVAEEVHRAIAKREPYKEDISRVQQNEDGSTTFINW